MNGENRGTPAKLPLPQRAHDDGRRDNQSCRADHGEQQRHPEIVGKPALIPRAAELLQFDELRQHHTGQRRRDEIEHLRNANRRTIHASLFAPG